MASLEVIRGPDEGHAFALEGDELTMGRSRRTDVTLTDKEVSGHHARFTRDGDRYILTDLGSSNQTFVNGHRVKEIPLQPGDEIALGQTVLRYAEGPARQAPPPEQGGRGAGPPPKIVSQPGAARGDDERAEAEPPPPPEPVIGNESTRAGIWPGAFRIRLGKRLLEAPFGKRIVRTLVCPSCWHAFPADEVHFVAKHPYLLGDPVVGRDEFKRFLAKRFTVGGEALDERGLPTTELACPRCHLPLPEAALEVFPLFISIVGPPASGKSYLLTTMTRELRQRLPRFGLAFSDTDPVANAAVHEYERTLFLNPRPDEPTEIPKTQRDDQRLHKIAQIDGVEVRLPVPLQFTLEPTPGHPRFAHAHRVRRNVVLYDNAGEDFLPRPEEAGSAAAQHLAKSEILLVLFDPTQEPRLRPHCRSDDPQLAGGLRPGSQQTLVQFSQETIVRELAVRVRRYLHLPQDRQFPRPLIVVVAKCDVLTGVDGLAVDDEPFVEPAHEGPVRLDVGRVERTSEALRTLLRRLCPEFVATAENLGRIVRYIPVTSLGCSPEIVRRGDHTFYGVRPRDIRPKWVTVPLLYCLCRWGPRGLVAAAEGTP